MVEISIWKFYSLILIISAQRAAFDRITSLIDVAPPAVFPQRFYCLGIYVSRTYCFLPSGVMAQK